MNEKFDKNDNLIYWKTSYGDEYWQEFDKNGNRTYMKNTDGWEYWQEYDENNNLVHFKTSNGTEYWYKYNEDNESILITEQEFKQIEKAKARKEFLSRKYCSRFELIDI